MRLDFPRGPPSPEGPLQARPGRLAGEEGDGAHVLTSSDTSARLLVSGETGTEERGRGSPGQNIIHWKKTEGGRGGGEGLRVARTPA